MWKTSEIKWPCIALVAIVVAMGLRPGDSSWFFDMSLDFEIAMQYNATPSHLLGISLPFSPAPYALQGTHGIRYGPLPIWIDQIFLAFTHDPIVMTAIRAVAVSALISLSLLWLTQLLRVSPWLAVVMMLSPWMWYYSRQLWDNSLLVPLTALLFVSYGQFLQSKRPWAICLAVVCAALSCLVHLMAAPVVLVLALHAIFFETRWIAKFKWPVLATIFVMLVISEPYLRFLTTFHGSHVPNYDPWWRGWLFPLFGAQHITAQNIGYLLEENWEIINPPALRIAFLTACIVTCLGYLACWAGMMLAIAPARRALKRHRDAATVEQLCLIGLAAFLVQTVFDGMEHVSLYPHYHNTTWIIYVMFACLGFTALPRWFGSQSIFARLTVPAYAASLLFVECIVAWQIARNGGMKGNHYNAALSNQMQVASEIDRLSDAGSIDVRVDYWQREPKTLPVLCKLAEGLPSNSPLDNLPARRLVVRFRDAFPGDARIVVDSYPLAVGDAGQR